MCVLFYPEAESQKAITLSGVIYSWNYLEHYQAEMQSRSLLRTGFHSSQVLFSEWSTSSSPYSLPNLTDLEIIYLFWEIIKNLHYIIPAELRPVCGLHLVLPVTTM